MSATNVLILTTLLTNTAPIHPVEMPTRNERIERRAIIQRQVTAVTNETAVVWSTNDIIIGLTITYEVRSEIWTKKPLPADYYLKSQPPPPYAPGFSPGSTKQ